MAAKQSNKNPNQVPRTGRTKPKPEATGQDLHVPIPAMATVSTDLFELVGTLMVKKSAKVQAFNTNLCIHHKTDRQIGCLEDLVPWNLLEVHLKSIDKVSFTAGLVDKYQLYPF